MLETDLYLNPRNQMQHNRESRGNLNTINTTGNYNTGNSIQSSNISQRRTLEQENEAMLQGSSMQRGVRNTRGALPGQSNSQMDSYQRTSPSNVYVNSYSYANPNPEIQRESQRDGGASRLTMNYGMQERQMALPGSRGMQQSQSANNIHAYDIPQQPGNNEKLAREFLENHRQM